MEKLIKEMIVEYGALRYWGERMRRLQKEYSKRKNNEVMKKAETAERKFDEVLKSIIRKENQLPFG